MSDQTALDRLDLYLSSLDEGKKKQLDNLLSTELSRPWLATPGPQLNCFLSTADLCLFGGSAGGGKTDLICGLALTEHQRTVIFRRQSSDLTAFWERLLVLAKDPIAKNVNLKKLTTSDSRMVECGHLDSPDAEKAWQGRDHDLICVERGTKVLLAGDGYLPIENLTVGQWIETLDGPKRVSKTFPARWKESLKIKVSLGDGQSFEQVQSANHCLLRTVSSAPPRRNQSSFPSLISFSKLFRAFRISLRATPTTFSRLLRRLDISLRDFWRSSSKSPSLEGSEHDLGYAGVSSTAALSQDGSFGYKPSFFSEFSPLPPASSPPQGPQSRLFLKGENRNIFSHYFVGYEPSYVRRRSSPLDFWDRCLAYFRPCGGRTPLSWGRCSESDHGQLSLVQSSGAVVPSPIGYFPRCLWNIRKYIVRKREYPHPYTKGTRYTDKPILEIPYACVPVGVRELFDIEVEDANHYITDGGFINKNCFDEGAQLSPFKVNFVLGWLRTSLPNQRCRAVIASNPPIGGEGAYLLEWFAPWLDPFFPNPAKHGELRWAVTVGDDKELKTIWVDGPEIIWLNQDKTWRLATQEEIDHRPRHDQVNKPLSRTFIPSRLDDNPYLRDTNYRAQLNSMPEPLRSQLLHGDFLTGREDDEWQVIPSTWVREAQTRWAEAAKDISKPSAGKRQIALGVDVASGGADKTTIAPLYLTKDDLYFFDRIKSWPGRETPDGPSVANLILSTRRDASVVGIDMTGGWGGSARDYLAENHQMKVVGIVFSSGASGGDASTRLGFANLRAKMYWQFRNALDPSKSGMEGRKDVALPPGDRILAQLTAARWYPRSGKIVIEAKDEIRQRLGSSPDEADAIVEAWHVRNMKTKALSEGSSNHRVLNEFNSRSARLSWMG